MRFLEKTSGVSADFNDSRNANCVPASDWSAGILSNRRQPWREGRSVMWSFLRRKSSVKRLDTKPQRGNGEPLKWFVVGVNQAESNGSRIENFLTPLGPSDWAHGLLPPEAIAGRLAQTDGETPSLEGPGRVDPAGFARNRTFHQFLHYVIGKHGPSIPDLARDAARQGDGSMGIIDLRTPEGIHGNVPWEDVIGLFGVQSGKLGEYHPNEEYCAFTGNGLMQLEPALAALYRMELLSLCEKRT